MEQTENASFRLGYPADSGFKQTDIAFFKALPSLDQLFSSKGAIPRLFVTDATIAHLSALRPFVERFAKKEVQCAYTNVEFAAENGSDILLVLKAGEAYKTMQSVLSIVQAALDKNCTRESEFVAIGGGVICDMTAFAASIFKRGIKVHFVPTTLLAMVDAAIGGKSGCDFEGYKNMIGSFWPAETLSVWPGFVQSLPKNEYLSGLGEAIKTALLFSPTLFKTFTAEYDKILQRDEGLLFSIISECARAKALVVQKDFREKGERAFLNLGHTFGHALEAVAGLGSITHGEAVCWGISRALALSERLGLCKSTYAQEASDMLLRYGYDTKSVPSALTSLFLQGKEVYLKKMLGAMRKDKKNQSAQSIRVILQRNIGQTVIQTVQDKDIEAVLV